MTVDIIKKLDDLNETSHFLVDGLRKQGGCLGHISDVVSKILTAVSDRDEPTESPLMGALAEIIGLLDRHARSLDRIEDRLTKIEKRP